MLIRVKTGTCIVFDLEETSGQTAASSDFKIVAIWSETIDAKLLVGIAPWLVGRSVSGVSVTTTGSRVSFAIGPLAIKPRTAEVQLEGATLKLALQVGIEQSFRPAIQNGRLPVNTRLPVVEVEGLSSGAVTVQSAGKGTTPVRRNTVEHQALEDARTAREARSGASR